MSTGPQLTDSDRGYVTAESKRRFTLIAGVMGAVCFLAQTVLPMALMFLIMVPSMATHDFTMIDVDQAALWRDELWFTQRTIPVNWRDPERSAPAVALARVRLADLSSAGPAVPLSGETDSTPSLLPVGDRLWVIGANEVGYYKDGSFTRLEGAGRPARPSKPFVYGGNPAVISLGGVPALNTLRLEAGRAAWTTRELVLGLRPEGGALHALQAVEASGRLYLFAELCTETPDHCSLSYRDLEQEAWLPVVDELCSCATWTAVALESRPAVVLSEPEGRRTQLSVVALGANGPRRDTVDMGKPGRMALDGWRAFSSGNRLVLVSQGMPGSLKLAEWADGRVVRSVRNQGTFPFPFGGNMMLFMVIPQLLPIVLSLLLALILTAQMRRHRVQEYAFEGQRRTFASLWQRALAQLVDVIPLLAGFVVPGFWWWRMFSDPERFLENGPFEGGAWFPLLFFGLSIAAFGWALLVLVVYSYLEGRFGKTPGKWLLRIRVLGTDLRPCGFRRAFLRNLLTFVDGFFSFLVGALLVALTESWQRLGDLAARTIVVTDAGAEDHLPASRS